MHQGSQPGVGTRRGRTLFIGLFAVVLAGVLLVAGMWMLLPDTSIAGPRKHDFGVILINDGQGSATHTFTFTNNSDTDYEILSVNESCKCTDVDVSASFLAARESVDLTVTMTLNVSGKKTSSVRMLLSDDTVITVWLEASGRQKYPLQVTQGLNDDGVLVLKNGVEQRLTLVVETEVGEAPEVLSASEGMLNVHVMEVTPWTQVLKGDASSDLPSRWKCSVVVRQSEIREDPGDDPQIVLSTNTPSSHSIRTLVPVRMETAEGR